MTAVLGYLNGGGTLSVAGMMFVNEQSWAHVVSAACRVLGVSLESVLEPAERAALRGDIPPDGVIHR
jgi:hypothetical protein